MAEITKKLLNGDGKGNGGEEAVRFKDKLWAEKKKMWVVAGPAIFTRFSTFGVTVISQAFVGHIGPIQLAAYSLVFTVFLRFANGILLGMASALETLCGQAYGAKQYHMLGIYLQRSWLVLTICAVCLLPLFIFTAPILRVLGQDEEIIQVAKGTETYLGCALFFPLSFSSSAMRVPVTSSPQTNQPPKPNTNNSANPAPNLGFHSNPTSCYEPTSVLDLRGSPSPATEKPAPTTDVISGVAAADPSHQSLEWDEHVLRNMDWDSIMRDLGLDDDSATNLRSVSQLTPCSDHHQVVSHFTDFIASQQFDSNPQLVNHADINLQDVYSNQNSGYGLNSLDHLCNNFNGFSNLNVGFDFIEELIRAADCFDSNELQLAQAILARLNQRLRSPVGKPIQRAAFFFKEALVSLLSGTNRAARLSSWYEIVQTIRAYKAFSGLSPIPMFAQFTVNQALLDSLDWPSSPFLHIVDFDIGFGGQYASLMREMAERTDSSRLGPPFVRVTAVVPEEYAIETRLVKDNLTQFAQELRIRFQIEFVLARSFEMLSFKTIKFMEGERTAVLLSPAIFRRLSSENGAAGFVSDLRRVSPSVVVFVDSEGWTESSGATSFRREFVSSLEFYSMMLESLDTAAVAAGDWVRRIEMFLVRPKILAAVEGAAGPRVGSSSWKELFFGAGMRPVSLSQFADFQAECLLGKMQVRGFHVAKRQAELVLCWQDRALVATSAWRC